MTGSKMVVRAIRMAHVIGLVFVSSVFAAESRYPVPDKGYLGQRVEQLYRAEVGEDWKTFYSMTAPKLRSAMTFDQFLKESQGRRPFKVVSWRIQKIRGAERNDDNPADLDAVAQVAMDVFVEYTGGRREKMKDQTDYWVHIKGEWFWAWRGFPDD